MEEFTKNVTSFDNHPLVAHKVTHLCDINTGSKEFCEIVDELTMLMGYEALKDLKTKNVPIQAPLADFDSPVLADSPRGSWYGRGASPPFADGKGRAYRALP